MTPTWYDLLGVEPGASTEEIRAAWKAGIAELGPGDRRFRALNQAAEVLLDADRRAAYDASLEPDDDAPVDLAKEPEAAPEVEEPDRSGESGPEESEPPAVGPDAPEAPTGPLSPARRTIPAWVLAGLAVLVALLLACAGYLVTQPSDDAIAEATGEAQAAAERAATTILAYDWQTMDEDQAAADALLTPSYQEKYDPLFEVLKDNQDTTKTVVTVDEIVASGVVRSGEDRVQVLVLVNRSRTNAASADPVTFRDSLVMTMENDDGDWLVDCMDTNPLSDQAPTEDPC